MRIGIFTDDFLPRDSGVVTSILHLRRGLTELGHEVYIVAPSHPGYIDTDSGVIRLPSFDPILYHKLRMVLPRKKSVQQLVALDFDVVHSATQNSAGIFADYIAKRIGCPHINTAHTLLAEIATYYPGRTITGFIAFAQLYNMYFDDNIRLAIPGKTAAAGEPSLPWLKRQIWNGQMVFLNNVDHVIAPSLHANVRMRSHGLKTASTVIPNGIIPKFFNAPRTRKFLENDCLRVVCVGRLSKEKRQSILIRAVAANNNVSLDIIGDGPARAEYERLIAQLEVGGRVIVHGSRDHEYIRSILLQADLFALASHNFDTQGISLLEAAAAGLPIVYCDKKLAESVTPNASFYVDHGVEGFSNLFASFNRQSRSRESMGSYAKRFANGFSYQTFAKKTEEVYLNILLGSNVVSPKKVWQKVGR